MRRWLRLAPLALALGCSGLDEGEAGIVSLEVTVPTLSTLEVGEQLPELPLWLEPDLCVPLRLEESYMVTCGSLRMRG